MTINNKQVGKQKFIVDAGTLHKRKYIHAGT